MLTNRLVIYLMPCFEYKWNTNEKQSRTQMMCREAFISWILPTSLQNTNRVPQTMMKDDTRIFTIRLRVMMLSRTFRGGFLITSRSTGSTPKLEKDLKFILIRTINILAPKIVFLTKGGDKSVCNQFITSGLAARPWWCWSRGFAWHSEGWGNS